MLFVFTSLECEMNTASAGDTFRVSIPAQTLGTKIYYYISAVSNSGRTVTKPLTAPSGNFRFTIANPTAVQNSEIELNSFNLKQTLHFTILQQRFHRHTEVT